MAQGTGKILPLFINLDKPYQADKPEDALLPDESPFVKGVQWDINANPGSENGMNNPSGEGQNEYVLTPVRSNLPFKGIPLPVTGYNKNIGSFEHPLTHELYYFNYNSLSQHGIFVIDGDSGSVTRIIEDPKLAFTDNQEGFICHLRAAMRFVRDKDGNITEKHLVWTNGKKWQGWVNVLAAIGSLGFNDGIYPYWKLRPPHFDREELLEWAVRPPMQRPTVQTVDNTADDLGKINRIVDRAFRFAVSFQNTDGRTSILSPYSLPLTVKSEQFLNDTQNIPKKANITFHAGSPLTEKALIYVQECLSGDVLDPTAVWGDWKLYDTIEKFDTAPTGEYWLRVNPWSAYSYDTTFNTIVYTFDNSKTGTIVSQDDVKMIQPAMPQISSGMFDMDDAIALCNNRYGYNNFSKSLLSKISVTEKQKEVNVCARPMRTVYLYAYIGQCYPDFSYTSQFGYTYGEDTQVRFGGVRVSAFTPQVNVNVDESKFFQLDFADRESFRCYLKGTPYYADGEWIIVKSDNSIEEIGEIYDLSNADIQTLVQNVFDDGSYFACRFKLTVPAGKYIATLGRHNVNSSNDYRGTSTYIYGIANSRVKSTTLIYRPGGSILLTSIKPNAIDANDPVYGYSKEMEVDCVNADLDVWGNNHDLFYVYAPYNQFSSGQGRFRFIEGYFKESNSNPIPVEMFPYDMTRNNMDDGGRFTDKNGFYWAYTKAADSSQTDIRVTAKINCGYPKTFTIPTSSGGIGWKKNADAYLATNNDGVVGDCNRIVINGSVNNLLNTIPYANISVSVKDGPTVYSQTDGTFQIILHNGRNELRTSNIYINAGGNYLITIESCGQVPLFNFSESLIPCVNCAERVYPIPINVLVDIQSLNNTTSLKQGGKYSIGCAGADLAGRLMYVNIITDVEITSFLKRDNINATYLQSQLSGALQIASENPDIKWFSFYVSKNTNIKRYVEWVGDSIIYLDADGNQVTDTANASFAKILIQSLYDANVANNFTLLSKYQFVKGDRLRVYDDGDGNLFDTATYGDPIDITVLGTNYNQAAINAGLIPPQTNTFIDNTTEAEGVGLIVRYDSRLNKLKDKTGFWIEVYTPAKTDEVIPLFETPGFYPVINGEIAEFTGYDNGNPAYDFPLIFDIDYWDTYYLQRSIAGKYFNHPFESPNVTDEWGSNLTSGGRINVENKDARQAWIGGDVIRSDSFMKNGITNGLAMFREINRKNYGIYPFGEIVLAHSKRNRVIFICSNDWFPAEYNMPYAKVSNGQLVVTNLDENLSLPIPKSGPMYGMAKEDVGSVVVAEDYIFWYDRKNTAYVKCNYADAIDITLAGNGERGGLQSYINEKTEFINLWNSNHSSQSRFDVIAGIDAERGKVYLTFRPRRNNTNSFTSYISQRRFLDTSHQETFVYSIDDRGWVPLSNFTPESYGRLRGTWANHEFISFAAGRPFYHNNTPNDSFLKFYLQQTEPVITSVLNKETDMVKVLQSISQFANGSSFFFDLIYGTQQNCMSFIPESHVIEKEKTFYAEVLRDMASYPPVSQDELFRSMLFDGKRIFAPYFVCRMVQKYADLGKYFQLAGINYLYTNSATTKP